MRGQNCSQSTSPNSVRSKLASLPRTALDEWIISRLRMSPLGALSGPGVISPNLHTFSKRVAANHRCRGITPSSALGLRVSRHTSLGVSQKALYGWVFRLKFLQPPGRREHATPSFKCLSLADDIQLLHPRKLTISLSCRCCPAQVYGLLAAHLKFFRLSGKQPSRCVGSGSGRLAHIVCGALVGALVPEPPWARSGSAVAHQKPNFRTAHPPAGHGWGPRCLPREPHRPQQIFRPAPPTLLPPLSLLSLKPNPVADSLGRKRAIEHGLLFYLELALGSARPTLRTKTSTACSAIARLRAPRSQAISGSVKSPFAGEQIRYEKARWRSPRTDRQSQLH